MSFTASEDRCCHPHCQEASLKAHLIIELQQQTKENGFLDKKKNKMDVDIEVCNIT